MDLDKLIIAEFQLDSEASGEAIQATVDKLQNALFNRIGLRLSDELEEKDLAAITETFEDKGVDAAIEIMGNKITNFEKILKEELSNLKDEYDAI